MRNNRSNTHPNICKRYVHCLLSLRSYPSHPQISEDTIDSMGLTNAFPDLLLFNCCESYLKVIASGSSFAIARFSPVHFIGHSLVYRAKNFVPKQWACVTIFIPILPFMHVCECKKSSMFMQRKSNEMKRKTCLTIFRDGDFAVCLWRGCQQKFHRQTKTNTEDKKKALPPRSTKNFESLNFRFA